MEYSREDLVCLYLADYRSGDEPGIAHRAATVMGIADALELGDSVADRIDLLKDLQRLREAGLVEEHVDAAAGTDGSRRAFSLTEEGRERASELRQRVSDSTVAVTNGVAVEVTLDEMDRYFERAPLVRALARLTDDGTVPLDRYAGETFTDRTEELETLESALEAARNKGGRAVLVTGESGVGKSALLRELLDRLRSHEAEPAVAVGHCESETATPYSVFREALADLEAGPDVATLLDEAPAVDDDPAAVRAQRRGLFEDVATAIRDVAAEGPLVLVVEDLHLADEASFALFSYLVENVTEWIYPVLFLATFRTEAVDEGDRVAEFAASLADDDRHTWVDLEPLAPIDTRSILGRVLETEDLPGAFVEAVHDRTGGNPLFVEESAKHLRETGRVDPDAGEFPAGTDDLAVPDRVVDAIDERLADLDGTGHDVVALGAVAGTRVSLAVLAAASDLDRATLVDYADLLVASRVWERDDDGFRFVHGAIRETVLDRLDRPTERAFHRRVAGALETVHADDLDPHAGRIADHYREAGDDRAAVEYFVRAGDHAAGIYAHETAIDHYRSALELAREIDGDDAVDAEETPAGVGGTDAPDAAETPATAERTDASGDRPGDGETGQDGPPSVPAIAADLAEVHATVGEYDRAADLVRTGREADPDPREARGLAVLAGRIANRQSDYERAIATVTDALDWDDEPTEETPELLAVKAMAERKLDEYDRATDTAERMRNVAADLGLESSLADAHHAIGAIARERGQFETAREHYRTALSTYRELGDRTAVARIREKLGVIAFRQGEYDSASEHLGRALETARDVGHRFLVAETRQNLGLLRMRQGEYDRASEHYRAALSTFEEVGSDDEAATVRSNLGVIAHERGDYRRAIDNYEAAIATQQAIGNQRSATRSWINLGNAATELGEYDRAREALESALETARTIDDRHLVGVTRLNLGSLAFEQGDHDRAEEHFHAALTLLEEVGDRRWVGKARHDLGKVAHARGELDRARDCYETALSTFEAIGATDEVVETLDVLVEVTRDAGDEQAARSYAREGLETIDELDSGEAFAAQRDGFRDALDDLRDGE